MISCDLCTFTCISVILVSAVRMRGVFGGVLVYGVGLDRLYVALSPTKIPGVR